jgi:hypothetical protein
LEIHGIPTNATQRARLCALKGAVMKPEICIAWSLLITSLVVVMKTSALKMFFVTTENLD